jgi:HPt (histidine-containing phosphotransfer) domain-containing protein
MSDSPDAELQALLFEVWQRHLPTMHERLNTLERIASEASSGKLIEEIRAEGQSVAHKLAGNLGTFGHQQAGDIATHIEQILLSPAPSTLPVLGDLVRQLRQTLAEHL